MGVTQHAGMECHGEEETITGPAVNTTVHSVDRRYHSLKLVQSEVLSSDNFGEQTDHQAGSYLGSH